LINTLNTDEITRQRKNYAMRCAAWRAGPIPDKRPPGSFSLCVT